MTAGNAHDAVILSAGGANGAYEVGVLKALFEGESPATDYVPLDPGVFAGSSIGAYNAALMVSQLDGEDPAIEYLEHVWRDLIPSDGTDRNRVFRYRLNPLDLFGGYALVDAPRRVRDAGTDVRFQIGRAHV